MKPFAAPLAVAAFLPAVLAQTAASANPFLGRWDITVTTGRGSYPGWMQVERTDCCLDAFIQPRSGSAVHASSVKWDGSRLTVTIGQATEKGPATTWELTAGGGQFTGTVKQGSTVQGQLSGVPAPALKRPMPTAWTDPEPLFNGKDLTGWEPTSATASHWVAKNGELVNEDHGANLQTTRKFDDFKLHIEYNCPSGGNSGIYLRGRYEVQIEYEAVDANDAPHSIGSIYSFLAPSVNLPRTPGAWESFDITLVGRYVTIVRNGVKTIDNREIPGITGGALDSREGEPGPFYIQGDHTGGLRYRNITISLPKQ
ncbi:MAG TPA: DUF1080 domain-containing protein [Bryobacteraceae bacterium]|nr:DUF1080 domain-containing protein [Bryobacteraceae bacterium]